MFNIDNSLFMRALRKEKVPETPIWFMRQAGRYLPEYREVRKQAGSFLNLCKNPELACEVALQPLRRFSLDAAILFSDILTIPDAMNLGLNFIEGEGPCFSRPLQTVDSIESLELPANGSLDYVMAAVKLIRKSLPSNIPLIGFAGSPWTLACYMIEGKSSKDFKRVMDLVKNQPELIKLLLEKLSQAVSTYLIEQLKSGADLVMLFDTWGGLLPYEAYLQYSLKYMQDIIQNLKIYNSKAKVILFTKGGGGWLDAQASTGCDVISLDWLVDLKSAREAVGQKVALQGNLNPAILLEDATKIRQAVAKVLSSYGNGSGHIFNLGHGITPEVPIDSVKAMVEAVRELSPSYHKF